MAGDRVEARAARQAGEERGLGERERARGLVEVRLARRADAAQVRAEVDAVQVLLEDAVLRERPLDAQRERRLAPLAGEACAGAAGACARAAS